MIIYFDFLILIYIMNVCMRVDTLSYNIVFILFVFYRIDIK